MRITFVREAMRQGLWRTHVGFGTPAVKVVWLIHAQPIGRHSDLARARERGAFVHVSSRSRATV